MLTPRLAVMATPYARQSAGPWLVGVGNVSPGGGKRGDRHREPAADALGALCRPAGALALLFLVSATPAAAQYAAGGFAVVGGVFDATAGEYRMVATLGLPFAGYASAGAYCWVRADGRRSRRRRGRATAGSGSRARAPPPAGRAQPLTTRVGLTLELPEARPVRLELFDVTGRQVRTLVDETLAAGRHRLVWDGRDQARRPVGSGIYFVRADVSGWVVRQKLVAVR